LQIDLVELEAPVLFAQADAALRTEAAEIGAMLKRIPSSEQAAEQLLEYLPEFAMGVSSAAAEQGLLEAAVFRPALNVQQTIGSKSTHRVLTDIFDHPQPAASPPDCAEFEDVAFAPVHAPTSVRSTELTALIISLDIHR
jgi:hypothetical protein